MARRRRLDDLGCSIAGALDVLGEWWTLLVLRDLHYGLTRFEDLAEDLPIARNVLSARLSSLADAGLVTRERYQTRPDRHEYRLTEQGHDTFGILMALMAWGDRWTGDEKPVSVLCRTCRGETTPIVACGECAAPLGPGDVGVRPNLGQTVPRPTLRLATPPGTEGAAPDGA